jgi:hypothetical protein
VAATRNREAVAVPHHHQHRPMVQSAVVAFGSVRRIPAVDDDDDRESIEEAAVHVHTWDRHPGLHNMPVLAAAVEVHGRRRLGQAPPRPVLAWQHRSVVAVALLPERVAAVEALAAAVVVVAAAAAAAA